MYLIETGIYYANSIKDLLENKKEVEKATIVPDKFRRYGLSHNLIAFVGVGVVNYRHLDKTASYSWWRDTFDGKTGEISDFGSFSDPEKSLEIIVKGLGIFDSLEFPRIISRKKRELLRDGMRMDICYIAYLPHSPVPWQFLKHNDMGGYVWLIGYETRDQAMRDRNQEREKGLGLRPAQLAPSPI